VLFRSNEQVFRSGDAGTNWAAATNGIPADVIRDLAVDPRSPSVLYAALNGGSGQNLMRSADAGASWQAFSLPGGGYSSSVVVDNVDPQTIHVGHNDSVWDYFNRRGGARVFGLPTSRTFQFLGFNSQFFQRAVMQQAPDGSVRLINLLDPGLLPFTSFNGAVVPGPDSSLTAAAPAPG